jgi:hypothetical protein
MAAAAGHASDTEAAVARARLLAEAGAAAVAVAADAAGAGDNAATVHFEHNREQQALRERDMTHPSTSLPRRAVRFAAAACAIATLFLFPATSWAQRSFSLLPGASAPEKFKSPDDAVTALVAAVRSDDARKMIGVLGAAAREIVLSGDDVADQKARAAFLIAYDAKHQIVKKGETGAELVVGLSDWTLPIPLVENKGSWQFDPVRGREEVLFRRIGANELFAIQVSLAYVDAQNEYAAMNPQGTRVDSYARRIISSPGKKDGLYWPSSANEPRSPLGAQAALATLEGYRFGQTPIPYHGYYYKILTAQGPTAPGGATDYMVKDQMIGGFALVAYPAEYGNSGVMTFLVNHAGVVFQKDLGIRTVHLASRMRAFNPDHTWKRVPDEDLAAR